MMKILSTLKLLSCKIFKGEIQHIHSLRNAQLNDATKPINDGNAKMLGTKIWKILKEKLS